MPTSTVTQSTTRPAAVLTGKGRAAALLITVCERWESLSPAQRAQCAEILERLAAALRREQARPVDGRVVLAGRVAS